MNALHWREPLWLLLVLYPLLLAAWGYFQQRSHAQRYADPHLLPWVQAHPPPHGWQRLISRPALWAMAWVLFAISLAGPRLPQAQPDTLADAQLDVLVVLDISRSMKATDIAPNRLQRAALELHECLNIARNSRVGIIVYGARPHLFAPLTSDFAALRFYLQHLETLVLPTQGSNPAAALDFARSELAARDKPLPAAILWVTDGDIPVPQIAALQTSITALQQANIPLYSLGIGTEDGEAIPLAGGKWLEHDGQAVRSRLNSALLQTLSTQTGGQYSAVKDDASDWETLYTHGIAQAFPAQAEEGQQWQELYVWVLFAAIGVVFMALKKPIPSPSLIKEGSKKIGAPSSSSPDKGALAPPEAAGRLGGVSFFFLCLTLSTFPDPTQADETALTSGIEAYRAENYEAATQHFTAAVFAAPNDTERARALHNLGNSYFQQGDYAAATQVFRDALTYNPDQISTQQNLALSTEVQAELERRMDAGKRAAADNASTGARRERNTNTLDWDQASTLTLGEGKDAPVNAPPPDVVPPDFAKLVNKGMARLAETGAADPQTWRKSQQSLDDARIALQQLDDNPAALWKRLFEVEEGYPAPQTQPNDLPGVLPW